LNCHFCHAFLISIVFQTLYISESQFLRRNKIKFVNNDIMFNSKDIYIAQAFCSLKLEDDSLIGFVIFGSLSIFNESREHGINNGN